MALSIEKLQQALALIQSANEEASAPDGEEPDDTGGDDETPAEEPAALSLSENIIASIPDAQVVGISESITAFDFDCSAQDFILYGRCQLSGLSGECGVISLETADQSKWLQVGIGYNFATSSAAVGRISLRAKGSSTYTSAGASGVESVASAADFAIHLDCDRGYLNLWIKGDTGYTWAGSCAAPRFSIEQVRFYTRNGTSAPAGQDVTFSDVVVCSPNFVSIGDSVTAGHNGFDPNGGYYSGTDNGLSQYQAHCWPFASLRNSVIINKGVGGQSTAQVGARISEAHKHGNPAVLLAVQNNDYSAEVSLEQRTANIQANIDACVAAGCTVVLVGNIYPNSSYTNGAANSAYFKQWHAEQFPLLTGYAAFADVMAALADSSTGNIQSQYTSDGLHPNAAGYVVIGTVVAGVLASVVGLE